MKQKNKVTCINCWDENHRSYQNEEGKPAKRKRIIATKSSLIKVTTLLIAKVKEIAKAMMATITSPFVTRIQQDQKS